MSVNKFVSSGIEQVRNIQLNLNQHFSRNFPLKFGMRMIQVCLLYSNFYGTCTKGINNHSCVRQEKNTSKVSHFRPKNCVDDDAVWFWFVMLISCVCYVSQRSHCCYSSYYYY